MHLITRLLFSLRDYIFTKQYNTHNINAVYNFGFVRFLNVILCATDVKSF